MKEQFLELAYRLVGHPQRLNLSIAAVLGNITQATYLLACCVFIILLATTASGVLAGSIFRFSYVVRCHPKISIFALCCFSVAIASAILVSQLNWSHLPLGYLVAMITGGALSSLCLSTRLKIGTSNALIPILVAPLLATLLICMPQPDGISLSLFVVMFPCLGYVTWRLLSNDPLGGLTNGHYQAALCFALFVMALVYGFLCINVFNWSGQEDQLAIHWGVFVSGAQSITLHLIPYYDVPLQYGLGPTLAAYAFCNIDGNCWHGLYWLLVVLYPAYSLLLYRAYCGAYPEAKLPLYLLFALLAFVSPICWNSSGPIHALTVPSTGPLRFMPVLALLLLLHSRHIRMSYALAIINIWWSFDAAIMSVMCLFSSECVRLDFKGAALRVAGVAITSLLLGMASMLAIWGHLPDLSAYLEYLFHMPGKLDPEFFGSVWVFFMMLAVSVAVIAVPQPTEDLRLSAAIAGTTLATLLYFLSRSVSVNIDNLMPFIVLLILRAAWLHRNTESWRILCGAFFGVILGGIVLPVWFGGAERGWSYDVDALFANERKREVELVAHLDKAHFGIVTALKDQAPPRTQRLRWALIDSWGEWFSLPAARQQVYTERSLAKMPDQRPAGCMVVYKDYVSLVAGYTTVFDVVSQYVADEYVMYGLLRKGATLAPGQDPCSTRTTRHVYF